MGAPTDVGGYGYVPMGLGGLSCFMLFWNKFMNPGAGVREKLIWGYTCYSVFPSLEIINC